jgi:hypothetical protein
MVELFLISNFSGILLAIDGNCKGFYCKHNAQYVYVMTETEKKHCTDMCKDYFVVYDNNDYLIEQCRRHANII